MQNLVNDTPPAKKNYDFVDSIRGISMMSIVADHTFNLGTYLFHTTNTAFWVYVFDIQLAKFGTVAFFLLAGFLLGDKFVTYTSGQYISRRFKSTFKPWLIWSLIFLFAILLRDFLNYLHYGSGGFHLFSYLADDLSIVYLYSNYWFIINFLICISILLIFKKNLYSWKLGAALLACTLFYSINVYFEWITPLHTTALFGFVFFLWLGAQLHKHWAVVQSKINTTSFFWFILIFVACLAWAIIEFKVLYNAKSADPYNTLRVSNIAYSLAAFALLLKFKSFKRIDRLKPRETTYGIYLIHYILVFSLLPEVLIHFNLPKLGDMSTGTIVVYQLFRFLSVYIVTVILVKLINRTKFSWILGSNIRSNKTVA